MADIEHAAPDSQPDDEHAGAAGSGDDATDDCHMVGPKRRLFIWMRRVAVALVCLGSAGALAAAYLNDRWFVHPHTTQPQHVDAVVVLAGGNGERLETALKLMDAGISDTIVLNQGADWFYPPSVPVKELCASGSPKFTVLCVVALPDSTKGEAMTISDLLEKRGAQSLAVVTSKYHISRSERWFDRCFDGTVYPVAADVVATRPQLIHEWLSVLHQFILDRDCR